MESAGEPAGGVWAPPTHAATETMTAQQDTAGDGQDSTDAESILRGSFDKVGECEVGVEESALAGTSARLVVRVEDNLAHVTVDLTAEETEQLRDGLDELAED